MNLPDPREDGICCQCNKHKSVTIDGRFCRKCLRNVVVKLTPMVGCYKKRNDGAGNRTCGENSFENVVRAIEDNGS